MEEINLSKFFKDLKLQTRLKILACVSHFKNIMKEKEIKIPIAMKRIKKLLINLQ